MVECEVTSENALSYNACQDGTITGLTILFKSLVIFAASMLRPATARPVTQR
jgi:hypothetical protein